jgi:hypothetical protein
MALPCRRRGGREEAEFRCVLTGEVAQRLLRLLIDHQHRSPLWLPPPAAALALRDPEVEPLQRLLNTLTQRDTHTDQAALLQDARRLADEKGYAARSALRLVATILYGYIALAVIPLEHRAADHAHC